jgi:DNA primase
MDRSELPALISTWVDGLWSGEAEPIKFLLDRGLDTEHIEKYHLGYTREGIDGRYRNCISIPYLSGTGDLRGVRFRRLDDGQPKYLHVKAQRGHLFNVGSVKHKRVYLTEGEFDAIILEQLGLPAVGVPGAESFKEEWKWLFVGNEVRIIFDGDDAGRQSAGQLNRLLRKVADETMVVKLPDGEDVSSLYTNSPDILDQILGDMDA